MMLASGVVVALVVTLWMKKSIWLVLEIVLFILSLLLFGFIFCVLYWGIVFDRNESLDLNWRGGTIDRWLEPVGPDGWFDLDGDDPLSIIVGLLLGLLLSG